MAAVFTWKSQPALAASGEARVPDAPSLVCIRQRPLAGACENAWHLAASAADPHWLAHAWAVVAVNPRAPSLWMPLVPMEGGAKLLTAGAAKRSRRPWRRGGTCSARGGKEWPRAFVHSFGP